MDIASRLLMFLDVVEKGSFARVAEARNVYRSVVSKQIAKLEDELDVRLLNRSTRNISLTAAGAEMVKKAQELRYLLNDAVHTAQNFHTEARGLLKISAASELAECVIQPVINEFQKRFPQVQIELNLDDRFVDIVGEGVDLAIRVGEPRDSSLIARFLARNRLVILASPEFIATYGMPQTPEQLAQLPAASYASHHFKYEAIDYIDAQGEPRQIPLQSNYFTNNLGLMRQKALSGAAYFVSPAFYVDQDIREKRLIPLLTEMNLPDYAAIYAIYPHRDLPVRTRLFFEALKQYIGSEQPFWERNIPGFEQMYGNVRRPPRVPR